ncbi:MAG TPA: hypothetical protein PLM75_08305, partial [bacterium]|nr:hypothetical protein [bacterium]
MNINFFDENKNNVRLYLSSFIKNLKDYNEKEKLKNYFDRLLVLEEEYRKYENEWIDDAEYNCDYDENCRIDDEIDDEVEYEIDKEHPYYQAQQKLLDLHNEIIKKEIENVVKDDEIHFIIKNILLAEIMSNIDEEVAIDYYKYLFDFVYINANKLLISRRMIDLIYILAENNLDASPYNDKKKVMKYEEYLHSLIAHALNDDISDANVYMLVGLIYDLLGDVNNAIAYLNLAKRHIGYVIIDVYKKMLFISKNIKRKSVEYIIEYIETLTSFKTTKKLTYENLNLIIMRKNEYFYDFLSNKKIDQLKKYMDTDNIFPETIYYLIFLVNFYFEKKNYDLVEKYCEKIL